MNYQNILINIDIISMSSIKLGNDFIYVLKFGHEFITNGKFHSHKLDNNNKVDIKGGGQLGRSEHGNPHFSLYFDNNQVEIYIPGWKNSTISIVQDLDFKKGDLPGNKKKEIIGLLNKDDNLLSIGRLWNKVNIDNQTPNLEFVKWNNL